MFGRTWIQYPNSNYEVSQLGEVRHSVTKNEPTQILSDKGYLRVGIFVSGKRKHVRVHRMVARCFLKPVAGKNLVNHKDTNKLNNYYTNTEYMTVQENTKHAYDNGLICMKTVRSFKKNAKRG